MTKLVGSMRGGVTNTSLGFNPRPAAEAWGRPGLQWRRQQRQSKPKLEPKPKQSTGGCDWWREEEALVDRTGPGGQPRRRSLRSRLSTEEEGRVRRKGAGPPPPEFGSLRGAVGTIVRTTMEGVGPRRGSGEWWPQGEPCR